MTDPNRILLLKLGALGDVIMLMGAVHTWRSGLSSPPHITWICGQQAAPLLTAAKVADRIIPVDESLFYRKEGLGAQALEIARLTLRLAPLKFDRTIIAYRDSKYRLPLVLTRTGAISWFGRDGYGVEGKYHASEYLRLLLQQGEATSEEIRFPTINDPGLKQGWPFTSGNYYVVAPGGAKNILRDDHLRRWPVENYAEVARQMASRGTEVVLVGSPSDLWTSRYFEGISNRGLIHDLVGKLDLLGLYSVIRSSKGLITHDSGPLHFGVLAGVRVFSVFGPTRPHERLPSNQLEFSLWGGSQLSCRPCYDGVDYADCSHQDCMKEITPEHVLEKIQSYSSAPSSRLPGERPTPSSSGSKAPES